MVAGEPEQEVAAAQRLPHRLPAALAPAGVVGQRLEGELAQPQPVGVGGGARRHRLAAVVGQHFAQLVGEQRRAGAGAGAAEQVEREDDGGGP